mmetsp:Transcript_83773/g.240836  ORF Transcript_83773/g.240836 Transcript_83773/m.240836 type:complete len:272 (-) Transcript_83773:130-945(-)
MCQSQGLSCGAPLGLHRRWSRPLLRQLPPAAAAAAVVSNSPHSGLPRPFRRRLWRPWSRGHCLRGSHGLAHSPQSPGLGQRALADHARLRARGSHRHVALRKPQRPGRRLHHLHGARRPVLLVGVRAAPTLIRLSRSPCPLRGSSRSPHRLQPRRLLPLHSQQPAVRTSSSVLALCRHRHRVGPRHSRWPQSSLDRQGPPALRWPCSEAAQRLRRCRGAPAAECGNGSRSSRAAVVQCRRRQAPHNTSGAGSPRSAQPALPRSPWPQAMPL